MVVDLQEYIEKVLAGYFSPNPMPDMSGDMRKRFPPHMRRTLEKAAADVIKVVQNWKDDE